MDNKKVKWSLHCVCIKHKDIRQKPNLRNGIDDKYAVLSVGVDDYYSDKKAQFVRNSKSKNVTLMLFDERLFSTVAEGWVRSFAGFVSFGYGNTFLVIEKVFDAAGVPLGGEEPDFFKM